MITINEAKYLPQKLNEYKGNPLIEALTPIYAPQDVIKLLTVDPKHSECERELDEQYRFHGIAQLFRYFQPLDVHIEIEKYISRAIRQSYISRNPATPKYATSLAHGAEEIRQSMMNAASTFNSTAFGFTIIGMSGVGKTTGIEKVLNLYPQTIQHTNYNDAPMFLTQFVWAKIDCPFDGSLKGLCISFFTYVDNILGTDYTKKFSAYRMTVDMALPRMAQIARTHCLGVLVIDEIQHLKQAIRGGREKMLNFFVTLVNTVGVPVVLIGTTKAMSVLQDEFRQARRSSGQGAIVWERMQNDVSWEIMLRAMWKNQWTRKHSELTEEMKNVLYDTSQGIIDIAVKLYAMAQSKAIADGTEIVTVKEINVVAAEQLQLVKKMLDALRSGDVKKLAQYEDIMPINAHEYIAAQARRASVTIPTFNKDEPLPLEEQAVLQLVGLDIPSNTARSLVKKVIGKSAVGQPLSVVVKKALMLTLNLDSEKKEIELSEMDGDLRGISASNPYDTLKESGIIAEAGDEF